MSNLIRAAGVALVVMAHGCASAGAPPGAPERHIPPNIIAVSPDSGATNVNIRAIELRFDEVVSDRPSGAQALDQIFLISPRDGSPRVGWHRSRITIRPRKGFRANTAYRITLLPGLSDLRGNTRKEGLTWVFSTGPDFPPYGIMGRVFDWATEKPANNAFMEAISRADTTLAYVSASDSTGMFEIGPLPAGTYLVRGLIDQNSNRAIDPREKWDSTTVTVTNARATVELTAIERDSTPPAFSNVTAEDSTTLRVTFDKALASGNQLTPDKFRLQRADSSVVGIARVEWASAFEKAKAAADSARRAADTTQRRQPTPPRPPEERAAPAPPKPRNPAPENTIILHIAPPTVLTPGRYMLSASGLTNLVGHTSDIRRGFVITPPATRDTTHRAPNDTTRRRPPGRLW